MRKRLMAVTLSLLFAGSAYGQDLLLHLPLDGNLTNLGSIAAEPGMYVDEGEEEPRYVPGQLGQGMEFNSRATIAVPFRLDYNDYPAVTVTAWVRQALASSDTRALLASGGGPRVTISNRLTARVGARGVSFDDDMPRGQWVFVSVVIDLANGSARMQQGDSVYVADGIEPSAPSLREYRNPYDPDADSQAYIFVGAAQFRNWQQTARRISIDDLRLYSGVLSDEQILAIRDASPSPAMTDNGETDSDTDSNTGSGRTLEQMQADAAARNADVIGDISIDSPTDVLPEGNAGSGRTLEQMRADAAARNAPLFDGVAVNSPLQLPEGSDEQEQEQEEGVFGGLGGLGPLNGSGNRSVGDFLLDAEFRRQATGNVRDCTSFSEVIADLATSFRDSIVEAAASNVCGLLTQPVASSRSAASIQDAAGYETPEFVQDLFDETYDRCVANTTAAANLPDNMLGYWNQLVGRDSWATIGPRQIQFGVPENGNLVVPGDRKFISTMPMMSMGNARLNVDLAESDGRARVNMRVCHVTMNNEYSRLTSVSINETPEERDNQSQFVVETFDGLGTGFVIVYMDGSGRIGQYFRYSLTIER